MLLPPVLVQDEGAHHAPATPKTFAKVLARLFGGAPAFEAGGDDSRYHDDRMAGLDALPLGVQAD